MFDHTKYLMPEPVLKKTIILGNDHKSVAAAYEESVRYTALEAFKKDDAKRAELWRGYDAWNLNDREDAKELLAELDAHGKRPPSIGKDEGIEAFANRRDRWYA